MGLCAVKVVILCFSFNSVQVRNIQHLMTVYLKNSFTTAETVSSSTVNARLAEVIEGRIQKQSLKPLCHFFFFFVTVCLKIPQQEKLPKPLLAYYTKNPLKMV